MFTAVSATEQSYAAKLYFFVTVFVILIIIMCNEIKKSASSCNIRLCKLVFTGLAHCLLPMYQTLKNLHTQPYVTLIDNSTCFMFLFYSGCIQLGQCVIESKNWILT